MRGARGALCDARAPGRTHSRGERLGSLREDSPQAAPRNGHDVGGGGCALGDALLGGAQLRQSVGHVGEQDAVCVGPEERAETGGVQYRLVINVELPELLRGVLARRGAVRGAVGLEDTVRGWPG